MQEERKLTAKGRRLLKEKEAYEGPKLSLFLRGSRTSQIVTSCMKDFNKLRSQFSTYFSKKHSEVLPFESTELIEKRCEKINCSLFGFGSHSKKRPHNLILGRTYDKQVLDMAELTIKDYTPLSSYKGSETPRDLKPVIIFQGSVWETSAHLRTLKSILHDFFRLSSTESVSIKAIRRMLVFGATDETVIWMKHYEMPQEAKIDSASDASSLREVGPYCCFGIKRVKNPSQELRKAAYKVLQIEKPEPKKKIKNVKTTKLGEQEGRLYIQRQDLTGLSLLNSKRQKKKE